MVYNVLHLLLPQFENECLDGTDYRIQMWIIPSFIMNAQKLRDAVPMHPVSFPGLLKDECRDLMGMRFLLLLPREEDDPLKFNFSVFLDFSNVGLWTIRPNRVDKLDFLK